MNKKTLKILEWKKIKDHVKRYALTYKGKAMINDLSPTKDLSTLSHLHRQVEDGVSIILQIECPPLSSFENIDEILKRLEIGGSLSIPEILKVRGILGVSSRVFDYYKNNKEQITSLYINRVFEPIAPHKLLLKEIDRIILDEDTIADNASPELKKIRRNMDKLNNAIRDKLNSYVVSSTYSKMFMDNIVTVKNGRYCIPVKAEHKNSFKGIVQGASSTGKAVFIEPIAVVELGNELSNLEIIERQEIERVLAILSNQIREKSEEIAYNIDYLSELDFIFAKSNYALEINATKPVFTDNKSFNLVKARHPLLDKDSVVPIDISLGSTFKTLIITGPNTGGKTVALKTVGLLLSMASSGLFIPCHESSRVALFNDIYADIGDEQSIEQSLSTFSAHLINIVNILKKVTDNDLVLFDELGAGTDPIEGASLATAILENMREKEISTIATTHYSELKMYALSTTGVENGSCEFDIKSLRPTYKLLIGVPGKSNAFAISKRLGLNEDILTRARDLLESDETAFEDVLIELDKNKRKAKSEREKSKKILDEAYKEKNQLKKEREKFEKQRDRILSEAKREALEIVDRAKGEADEIIKDLRRASSNLDFKELEHGREKLRKSIKDLSAKEVFEQTSSVDINKLKVGDTVFVKTMDRNGILTNISKDKKELTVKLGILNTTVKLSDIRLTDEQIKEKAKVTRGSYRISKSSSIKTEIDLRGMLTLDGIEKLDKYLDDAYLSGLQQVTIIHGKGSGAMKEAVHKHLKKTEYIDSYRLGNYGEGDSGVSIVKFR